MRRTGRKPAAAHGVFNFMKMLPGLIALALTSCATIQPQQLEGLHSLLAVDGRPLPINTGPLPTRDGTRGDPYVLTRGHLDLSDGGRFELYQEYQDGRTGAVLAQQTQRGTYRVTGSRLTLTGDHQIYPSTQPNSWTGELRPTTISVHYGGSVLSFRR